MSSQKQALRIVQDRHCERGLLPHAMGALAGVAVFGRLKLQYLQQLRDPAPGLNSVKVRCHRRHLRMFFDGKVVE